MDMASHCISSFGSEIGTFLKYRYELIGGLARKPFLSLTVFFFGVYFERTITEFHRINL